jgi:lysophospholipase L1-like esterase
MQQLGVGEGKRLLTGIGLILGFAGTVSGQADFSVYRSLGDSLTHGTQGGKVVDYRTQPHAYPVLLAQQMGTQFPLALLTESTGNDQQTQIDAPNFVLGANLAVNGASLHDAIYREAQPLSPPSYLSGRTVDPVLAPRAGTPEHPVSGVTQVSAAVNDGATFATAWLGGNDFLQTLTRYGTVLDDFVYAQLGFHYGVDPLTVSGITDQASFAADYHTLVNTIVSSRPGVGMAVANFPYLSDIAGVLDKQELTALIGPNPMPDDAMTSILVAAAVLTNDVGYFGKDIWNVNMLANPANYWDASDVGLINAAIDGFNATIAHEAAVNNIALVDIQSLFHDLGSGVYHLGDWEINNSWFVNNLGQKKASTLSSDGVHPSDIGHALIANAFIDAINGHYGTNIPRLSDAQLKSILDNDPFVDNDLDGRIEGMPADYVPWLSVSTFAPDYTGDAPEIVPEPVSLAMLLLGAVSVIRRRDQ